MNRFTDKVVLVTGAGSGIGRATAQRLASEGATVACVDLAADTAEKTAAAIAEAGGTAKAWSCDVSQATAVASTVDAVISDLGRIDVVCNIAGIGKFAHSHEQPVEEFDKILAVNLNGSFYMCRFVLPHMVERGSGIIVNTASTAGIYGQPYSAAYCASKGGVALMTKALSNEYSGRGIRVNAIAPGGVETAIIQSFGFPEGAEPERFAKMTSPMGFSKPEDLASLFAYVASDEAHYMSGSIVVMDGGITA